MSAEDVPFDVWYAVFSIVQECAGYRFGEPSYDPKLDHIYELATGVLATLNVTPSEAQS